MTNLAWSPQVPHNGTCKGHPKLIISTGALLHLLLMTLLNCFLGDGIFQSYQILCQADNFVFTTLLLVYFITCTIILLMLNGCESLHSMSIENFNPSKQIVETQQHSTHRLHPECSLLHRALCLFSVHQHSTHRPPQSLLVLF